jgi:hypothetical protein
MVSLTISMYRARFSDATREAIRMKWHNRRALSEGKKVAVVVGMQQGLYLASSSKQTLPHFT